MRNPKRSARRRIERLAKQGDIFALAKLAHDMIDEPIVLRPKHQSASGEPQYHTVMTQQRRMRLLDVVCPDRRCPCCDEPKSNPRCFIVMRLADTLGCKSPMIAKIRAAASKTSRPDLVCVCRSCRVTHLADVKKTVLVRGLSDKHGLSIRK